MLYQMRASSTRPASLPVLSPHTGPGFARTLFARGYCFIGGRKRSDNAEAQFLATERTQHVFRRDLTHLAQALLRLTSAVRRGNEIVEHQQRMLRAGRLVAENAD